MGVANKYNKGGVKFEIDINGFEFKTLADLYAANVDELYIVDGLYINKKSNFDPHPVAIIGSLGALVDLPGHLTEDVEAMLQDPEAIEAIKTCKLGFRIEQYEQKKYKKICYGIRWEDVE